MVKMNKSLWLLFLLTMFVNISCSKDEVGPGSDGSDNGKDDNGEEVVEARFNSLEFDIASAKMMKAEGPDKDGIYTFNTTGGDPQILTKKLDKANDKDICVLAFEYRTVKKVGPFQIFFAPEISGSRSAFIDDIPSSEGSWKEYSCNLSEYINTFGWGKVNDYFRIDFCSEADVSFQIKNLRLRTKNEDEIKDEEIKANIENRVKELESSLPSYLNATFASKVANVSADLKNNKITISGSVESGQYELLEVTPYQDITINDVYKYIYPVQINGTSFSYSGDRYIEREGYVYDRMLSKFALVEKDGNGYKLASHAKYVNDVVNGPEKNMLPDGKPSSKKGMSAVGYDLIQKYPGELSELGITSAKVDVAFSNLLYLTQKANTTPISYGGKTYYVNNGFVSNLDRTLKSLQSDNIKVAITILINVNSEMGELLKHERFTSKGMYSMPRLSSAETVNCYAAALDYIAKRYSGTDSSNGRIHHWIMHNEVDAGETWTNMGSYANTPMNVYMDTHTKSMRMAYNIIRQYNPNAEIFISLTHHWSVDEKGTAKYAPKKMLELQNKYSEVEGDFKWAIAYHSYPEVLKEPDTWNDTRATFSMESQLVTFKNLEVLDKWVKTSANMYNKSVKRSVWLSENGINSPSYSDRDLELQAAGGAYAWKKVNGLDGIDAMQYHRWVDNTTLFDVYFGLRKENGEKKPIWDMYKAVGTGAEDSVLDQYLGVIGINDWNEIFKTSF